MNSAQRLAIKLVMAQAALFAAETALIHQLGSQVSVTQLAFVRGIAGLVLAIILARRIGLVVVRTRQLPLQLLRGSVALLYLWIMIYSFSHLPFADATAISYTQTAYIAAFSVLILGESVSPLRWAAAAVGILGALLIAKPAFAGWSSVYLVALFGTSLNGLSFVLNRYLQREDTETTTMFYANLVPVLANAPLLGIGGLPPADTLLWLPGLLLFGPLGVYLGIVAVKHANPAMLGPYTLLRLVIALLGAATIFHELPDTLSTIGVALIIASCMISSQNCIGGRVSFKGRAHIGKMCPFGRARLTAPRANVPPCQPSHRRRVGWLNT